MLLEVVRLLPESVVHPGILMSPPSSICLSQAQLTFLWGHLEPCSVGSPLARSQCHFEILTCKAEVVRKEVRSLHLLVQKEPGQEVLLVFCVGFRRLRQEQENHLTL